MISLMANIIEVEKKDSPVILDCLTPNCGHHVEFDLQKPPLPAFKPTNRMLKTEKGDVLKVYLTCDNPVTPHTNAYKIKMK